MTTDADRANAWLIDWIDWLPASERDAFLASLTDLLAAVRADERAAIVRYLALERGTDAEEEAR